MKRSDISGAMLAGGRATRMGGGDKGLLLAAGKPLAQWGVERLRAQTATVIINANRNFGEYKKFADSVTADSVGDFAGPLAGVHAAMTAAKTTWLLTVPCDAPFLPLTLAEKLSAAAETKYEIATATAGGRRQPVFMLARRSLRDNLFSFLQNGGRKIDAWYTTLSYIEVEFNDAAAFANINTREELAMAEKILAANRESREQ